MPWRPGTDHHLSPAAPAAGKAAIPDPRSRHIRARMRLGLDGTGQLRAAMPKTPPGGNALRHRTRNGQRADDPPAVAMGSNLFSRRRRVEGPRIRRTAEHGLPVDWSAIPNDLVGLSDEEIGSLPGWYYSVELRPGVFTKGEDFPSAALPRAALSRAEPKGWRCLDIGAMEGLITTVLCRRGAGRGHRL